MMPVLATICEPVSLAGRAARGVTGGGGLDDLPDEIEMRREPTEALQHRWQDSPQARVLG
jgi:hypothetical protein